MKYLLHSILILLFAGCTLLYPPDPQRAEALVQEADALIIRGDYTAAAARMQEASWYQPKNSMLYLRRGELLERTGKPADARRSYERALKKTPAEATAHPELLHRLASLLLLKLNEPGDARQLLKQLPADSPQYDDLLGLFASSEGKEREALLQFNKALAKHPNNELSAAILYHAALIYQRLADHKNVSATLYEAINRTSNPALAHDIENLWNLAKSEAK